MTRRIDEFQQPTGDPDRFTVRWQHAPKSLAEQDAEDARTDRIRAQKAERARRRQGVKA